MTLQTRRITNTVSLCSIQTDRFKTGVLTFTFILPLSPKNAAMSFLLSGIMQRGSQKYPSLALINQRLDDLYATEIEIRTTNLGENVLFTVTAELLDNRYTVDDTDIMEGVLDALADILLHPLTLEDRFDPSVVKQEIRLAIDEQNAKINNTRSYATKRCVEGMYRNQPAIPTIETLKDAFASTTEEELFAFHQHMLTHAALDIFYVGSTPIDTVAEKLRSAWTPNLPHQPIPFTPIHASLPNSFWEKSERMPVAQGKLSMGFRTGISITDSKQYHTLLVLNEILGGSAASKLFLNVREKMGLCYYCGSSASIYTGDILISSGIEVKNRSLAQEEILRQLQAIQSGNISDTEWNAAQKSLKNMYRQIYDNPLDLHSFYGIRRLLGVYETIEECQQSIATVTREEVIALAKNTVFDTVFFVEGTLTDSDAVEEEADHDE